jgi:hypothetical protein
MIVRIAAIGEQGNGGEGGNHKLALGHWIADHS